MGSFSRSWLEFRSSKSGVIVPPLCTILKSKENVSSKNHFHLYCTAFRNFLSSQPRCSCPVIVAQRLLVA